MNLGLSMGIILGVVMRKECGKLTKSSFSTFHHGLVYFGLLNVISNTEARLEKVWQLVVKNNLIGSLSDGFSGTDGANPLRNATSGFKKPIQIKLSSSDHKRR